MNSFMGRKPLDFQIDSGSDNDDDDDADSEEAGEERGSKGRPSESSEVSRHIPWRARGLTSPTE